jgi:hypothetical protein
LYGSNDKEWERVLVCEQDQLLAESTQKSCPALFWTCAGRTEKAANFVID